MATATAAAAQGAGGSPPASTAGAPVRVFRCRRVVAKQKKTANSCSSTVDLQLLLLLAEVMIYERK